MNNKGQSLILFVIILPIIFIFGVFVFDLANLYSEKTKLDNIAYDALYYKHSSNKSIAQAKLFVRQNDETIKIDEFTENSVCLSKDTEPIIGSVIENEKFTIKSCYESSIYNGILRIEEKGD